METKQHLLNFELLLLYCLRYIEVIYTLLRHNRPALFDGPSEPLLSNRLDSLTPKKAHEFVVCKCSCWLARRGKIIPESGVNKCPL